MSYLERCDNVWLDLALDPQQRLLRIERLSQYRSRLIWAFAICFIGLAIAIAERVFAKSSGGVWAVLGPLLCVLFNFAETQRELRLLKLVARMQPRQEIASEPQTSSVE